MTSARLSPSLVPLGGEQYHSSLRLKGGMTQSKFVGHSYIIGQISVGDPDPDPWPFLEDPGK